MFIEQKIASLHNLMFLIFPLGFRIISGIIKPVFYSILLSD